MTTMTSIQALLKEICSRHGVEIVYTFGSRCHEIKSYVDGTGSIDKTSPSDVDIGVKLSAGITLSVRNKVALSIELEDLLAVDGVDLAVISEADPFVAANIIRGERLYCEDSYLADEYELYILRRAGDLAPLERDRLNIVFGEPI